jgi:hypothetical protein
MGSVNTAEFRPKWSHRVVRTLFYSITGHSAKAIVMPSLLFAMG